MHTTEGKTTRFIHNGDYSGDVELINKKTGKSMGKVPFDELLMLVADCVRSEKVGRIEAATDKEILGLTPLPAARRPRAKR